MRIALTLLALGMAGASCLVAQTSNDFQQDFDEAVSRVATVYAYFDTKATRWNELPTLYASDLRVVRSRDEFIALLERVVDELYDAHAHLTVNLERSPRLVPSGTDLWAEWRGTDATITQVRDNSDAARAGLRPGAIVIAIDGLPIREAVEARMGRSYAHSVAAARDWALRTVLAGRHNTRRLLEVRESGTTRTVELPATDQFSSRSAPTEAWRKGSWGDLPNASCHTRSTRCRRKIAVPESAGAGSRTSHRAVTSLTRGRSPCS